jgi:hypothetical protein
METVHEDGEPLIQLASPGPGLVDTEVEARIEIEQEPAQPRLPTDLALVVVKEIAHSCLFGVSLRHEGAPAKRIRQLGPLLADPIGPDYGAIVTR